MPSMQIDTDHDANLEPCDDDNDDDFTADSDIGTLWLGGEKAIDALRLTPAEFAELALVPTIDEHSGRFWYSEHDLNAVAHLSCSIRLKRRWGVSDDEIERIGLPPVVTPPARQPISTM